MSPVQETISSKETSQYAENSEGIRTWKADLRGDRKEAGAKQVVGAAADGFGSGATTSFGSR